MKSYAKFIDENNVEYLEKPYVKYQVENTKIDKDGNKIKSMQMMTFSNPTEEQIKNAGYKEVIAEDKPEIDQNTHYLEPIYADGEVITKMWGAVEYVLDDTYLESEVMTNDENIS